MSTLEKTISYGEHDEDIILMHLFQSANRGFYIDIGAGWETAGSTTKALHQKGWNGINIEPNRSMIAEYQARRKGDINLQCIIADQNKLYDFFTFNDGSIQHASANYRYLISQKNSGFEITKIHGARLDYIWDNFVPEDQLVHFLKISANGFENEIITNTNWKKNRPWIVLVQTENLPGQKPNDGQKLDVDENDAPDWHQRLVENNYKLCHQHKVNRFYLASEHHDIAERFKIPTRFKSQFASYAAPTKSSSQSKPSAHHKITDHDRPEIRHFNRNDTPEPIGWQLREEVQQKLASLEQQREQLEQDLTTSNQQREQLEQNLTASYQQREQLEQDLTVSSQQHGQLEQDLTVSHQQREQLEQDLTASHQQREQLEQDLTASHQQRGQLEQDLTVSHQQREQLEQDLTASNQQRGQLEQDLTASNQQRGQLEQDLTASNQQRGQLERDLTVSHQQREQLERDLTVSHQQREHLERDLTVSHQQREQLEQGLAVSNQQREQLEQGLAVSNQQREQLEQGLAASNQQREQLEQDLAASNQQREQLEQNLTASHQQREQLEHRLTKLEEQHRKTHDQLAISQQKRNQYEQTVLRISKSPSYKIYKTVKNASSPVVKFVQHSLFLASCFVMAKVYNTTRNQPKFSYYVKKRLYPFPKLHQKIRYLIIAGRNRYPFSSNLGNRFSPNAIYQKILGLSKNLLNIKKLRKNLAKIIGQFVTRLDPTQQNTKGQEIKAESDPFILQSEATIAILEEQLVPTDKTVVFLYVAETCSSKFTTTTTRICHNLSVNLANAGAIVVLVHIRDKDLCLAPIEAHQRSSFVQQSGFKIEKDHERFYDPDCFARLITQLGQRLRKSWLLVPEIAVSHTSDHTVSPPPHLRLLKEARDHGLKIGFLDHDSLALIKHSSHNRALEITRYISDILQADAIWTSSPHATQRLNEYSMHHEKLARRYQPHLFLAALPGEFPTRRVRFNQASGDQTILCLGRINALHNQATLIKAFVDYKASTSDTRWKLVLCGQIDPDYQTVFHQSLGNNTAIEAIEYVGHVDEQQLHELFQKAAFTVFVSKLDGYALPVIESLWNLRPCLCSDLPAIRQIADGAGCVHVDPDNPDAIQDAMVSLIEDHAFYAGKVDEIIEQIPPTWYGYARSCLDVMEQYELSTITGRIIYYWVDATLSAPANTGVQRTNREYARALIAHGHHLVPIKWHNEKDQIVLANDQDLDWLAKWNGPHQDSWHLEWDPGKHQGKAIFFNVDLPWERTLDFFARVLATFKEHSIPCTAVFYDTIPYQMTDTYPIPVQNVAKAYMLMMDQMDHVYSISQTTNDELCRFLERNAPRGLMLQEKLHTVSLYEDFSTIDRVVNDIDSIEGTCHILSVGTVEPRKNHLNMLEAFLEAEKRSPKPLKLVMVGSDHTFDPTWPKRAEALVAQSPNITWLKKADDDELQAQYRKAHFTIYPSCAEGFGLPIVESLWFHLPCLTANFGQMAALAKQGGCLMSDVKDRTKLSQAIVDLANDKQLYKTLKEQIRQRPFKTLNDVVLDLSGHFDRLLENKKLEYEPAPKTPPLVTIPSRPLLSVCITAYNRHDWVSLNIANFCAVAEKLGPLVELIVCDNCSKEPIGNLIKHYADHPQVSIYRNPGNIGMINNLPQTASLASGEYIWMIGDDDLIHPGGLEKAIRVIESNQPDLIYLNYNLATNKAPPAEDAISDYLANAFNATKPSTSHGGRTRELCFYNENFFTGVYSFMAKAPLARRILMQKTNGKPFSNMQACVPTTFYILSNLANADAFWISEPILTVNTNVSWDQYAPIWLLERIPEVYDLAELHGTSKPAVDEWRQHTIDHVAPYFKRILEPDSVKQQPLFGQFNMGRFVRRNRHLGMFEPAFKNLTPIYQEAFEAKHPLASFTLQELEAIRHGQTE